MGLSQPAISHALTRLRAVFDDPLFLRRPHGMEPTSVALAIEPDIRAAVERIGHALRGDERFAPRDYQGTLRISALDYEGATLVPALLAALRIEAPCLSLSVHALPRDRAMQALAEARIDLALGFFWDLPETLIATPLIEETYLVAARADHPVLKAEDRLSAYLEAAHLVVAPGGDMTGIVDTSLAQDGLSRTVALSVPQFLTAFPALAESDLVATLPARIVRQYASAFGISHCAAPIALRPFTSSIVWHARDARNPLHRWVADTAERVLARGWSAF